MNHSRLGNSALDYTADGGRSVNNTALSMAGHSPSEFARSRKLGKFKEGDEDDAFNIYSQIRQLEQAGIKDQPKEVDLKSITGNNIVGQRLFKKTTQIKENKFGKTNDQMQILRELARQDPQQPP